LGTQGIETVVNRNSRNPVFEGDISFVLIQFGEHLYENILGQVFFGFSSWEFSANNAPNLRIEVLDQTARRVLVLLPHAPQAVW
jgi:hypothetical protein